MRFPLSTGMAKNGNFIPVIERNRALIPGPKGNDGNKGGEYFPHRECKKFTEPSFYVRLDFVFHCVTSGLKDCSAITAAH